jgi:hypothetical protein
LTNLIHIPKPNPVTDAGNEESEDESEESDISEEDELEGMLEEEGHNDWHNNEH